MHGNGGRLPKTCPFSHLSLIGKVYSLALFGSYGDRLFHRSILLVPALNDVGPWRQSFYCKRPVVSRHGEERMADHADIRAHPGVDVAFHRDHDFLAGEAL